MFPFPIDLLDLDIPPPGALVSDLVGYPFDSRYHSSMMITACNPSCRPAMQLIVVIVSLVSTRGTFAGDSTNSAAPRHVAGKTSFIWQTNIDRIGAMSVGADTIVIGGHNSALGKGQCIGLSKETGKIIWSVTHDRLPERVNDMGATITSTPCIDGDRVYYVSNRGELCCLGLKNGNAIWMLDMPRTFGVFKSDPGDAVGQAPSPIVVGDIVYCITGNGVDYHRMVIAPDAPSFIAVEKLSGKVIWSSNAPGKNICYGQWSTPAPAMVDGVQQILFPGGDGALYSFEPLTGKQLWKIDCRGPIINKYFYPDEFISAPPLVVGPTAYVSPAIDCEGAAVGRRILAIDLHTHTLRWAASPEGFSGTIGPMAFHNDTVYAAGILGTVVAIDARTGKTRWTRAFGDKDPTITITGGITVHDDRLYFTTQEGNLNILSAANGEILSRIDLNGTGIGTPVVDRDRLFVIAQEHVLAVRSAGR
jgi:outer membrane protein assembly factor BamB